MAPSTSSGRLERSFAKDVDTVIFVDVDGVLNVGAVDNGNAPLLLHQKNIDSASTLRANASKSLSNSIETVLSIVDRAVPGEEGCTYATFSCNSTDWSTILVRRLVEILKVAGDQCAVVLSSNWRQPKHAGRVRRLEEDIADHLGKSFAFDATTALRVERTASDRLRCVGDFVSMLSSQRDAADGHLRVLLLEDFFITPLNGWQCDRASMDSTEACEKYIQSRATEVYGGMDISVKLVHPYDEWDTPNGLRVQVGAGLSKLHVDAATEFMNAKRPRAHCGGKVKVGPPSSRLSQIVGAVSNKGQSLAKRWL